MRTLSIIALSTALALSAAGPASAWKNIASFVDWTKKAKSEIKNVNCWKNPFDNKCN